MEGAVWESPDGYIKKEVIRSGIWGLKPTENCLCNVKITDCSSVDVEKYYSLSVVIIGDGETNFQCLLDKCLLTMFPGEVAKISFKFKSGQDPSFTLELTDFKSNGLIYEWSAKIKYDLAEKHKKRGIELYKELRHVDASHRFARGLKILSSIPVEVDVPPDEVDGVRVEAMEHLKAAFYNNLASCYLKQCDYETVLNLCVKVLERDSTNIKALYKQAIARCETRDYEGSESTLLELLKLEPNNKAASEKLKFVNMKLSASKERVNSMIKLMFQK